MAFRGIYKPFSWNSPAQGKPSQLGPRSFAARAPQDSHRPPTQEEVENQAFHQDKFEAFGLQLKAQSATISPVEQERLGGLQTRMDDFWAQRMERVNAQPGSWAPAISPSAQGQPAQPAPSNKTGLQDHLKAGVENLSGYSLDDVRVHYNSSKPAQIQALAYTQGTEIHIAPGQERYLPHEAWHVVQQMQGRVQPTRHRDGVQISDHGGLEREADAMGTKGLQTRADSGPRKLLQPSSSALNNMGIIQMVRMNLAWPGFPISLAALEALIVEIDEQIRALGAESSEEVTSGFVDMARIMEWRGQLAESIQRLRDRDDGGSYTLAEIESRVGEKLQAYRAVVISCNNLRKGLNDSLAGYTTHQSNQQDIEDLTGTFEIFKGKKADKETAKKTQAPQKTPTGKGPVGIGSKWGSYGEKLKWKGQTEFHQHVPAESATIAKSLASQNILDALYNPRKAFWVADPKQFKLGSASGKALMVYRFPPDVARSLMEDFLICGSGDFAGDNEEEWVGETAHPDYTIWKTNEVGAYGIGSARLAQLASGVLIRAYDSNGVEIPRPR